MKKNLTSNYGIVMLKIIMVTNKDSVTSSYNWIRRNHITGVIYTTNHKNGVVTLTERNNNEHILYTVKGAIGFRIMARTKGKSSVIIISAKRVFSSVNTV